MLSTDHKIILAICFTFIFSVSMFFIDSRLSAQDKMLAFDKCISANIELQKLNSTNFVISNNCRL